MMIFSQQPADQIGNGKNDLFNKPGNFSQVIFTGILCEQISAVKSFGFSFSGFGLRSKNGRKKKKLTFERRDSTYLQAANDCVGSTGTYDYRFYG